ncbi:MAG: transposase [Cyclobacteriaceae bacterium]
MREILSQLKGTAMVAEEFAYLRTISKVLEQQTFLLDHPAKELKDRIVSLPRPYVRPIIRGKGNKRVEFGIACPGLSGKVHMLQVDGISFIDKMDFNNFNECTRLRISILKHKMVYGQAQQLGADRIYATISNRRYCTAMKIFPCFPKKGPRPLSEAEKLLSNEISRQRATVMEGVFGDHKNHYGLRKIRVKGEKKEKLMVFFATMTANAVKIAKRREKKESPPQLDRAA